MLVGKGPPNADLRGDVIFMTRSKPDNLPIRGAT